MPGRVAPGKSRGGRSVYSMSSENYLKLSQSYARLGAEAVDDVFFIIVQSGFKCVLSSQGETVWGDPVSILGVGLDLAAPFDGGRQGDVQPGHRGQSPGDCDGVLDGVVDDGRRQCSDRADGRQRHHQ